MNMLLHIRPRLYSDIRPVDLTKFEIPEIGLCLTGGIDLVTRRPCPNKWYAVACRKLGLKAIDGILVETDQALDELHTVAHWAIDVERIVTHHVHYKLLDHDFDAASDSMVLWYPCAEDLGGSSSRMPAWWTNEVAPVSAEPVMEIFPGRTRAETEDAEDQGMTVVRRQTFAMPTLERERVLCPRWRNRMPSIEAAFRASVIHPPTQSHSQLKQSIQ